MKTYLVEWHDLGYHTKEMQAASEHELRLQIERDCPQMLPVTITEKKERENEQAY